MNEITKFLRDEEGATAVEYGLIVGLIAAVIVLVVSQLGNEINTTFTKVKDCMTTPTACT